MYLKHETLAHSYDKHTTTQTRSSHLL